MSTQVRPDEAERESAGGRVVVVLVLGLALLAGAGYAAAYAGAGDNVPRNTTVAGIDIGGRSASAAVADLVEDDLAAPQDERASYLPGLVGGLLDQPQHLLAPCLVDVVPLELVADRRQA